MSKIRLLFRCGKSGRVGTAGFGQCLIDHLHHEEQVEEESEVHDTNFDLFHHEEDSVFLLHPSNSQHKHEDVSASVLAGKEKKEATPPGKNDDAPEEPPKKKARLNTMEKVASNVVLGHAPLCPARAVVRAAEKPVAWPTEKALKLAVVVLPSDRHGHVLITRRPTHMRAFPSCWVFPGGAVDPGEALVTAGARECFEETGLRCDVDSFNLFCAWESVYPTRLELGLPKSQYLVLFYTATVAMSEHPPAGQGAAKAIDGVVSSSSNSSGAGGNKKDDEGDGAHELSPHLRFSVNEVDLATFLSPALLDDSGLFAEEKKHSATGGDRGRQLKGWKAQPAPTMSSSSSLSSPSAAAASAPAAAPVAASTAAPAAAAATPKTTTPAAAAATASSGHGDVDAEAHSQNFDDENVYKRPMRTTIPLDSLRGVYPNSAGTGIGRGHLYALKQLAALHRRKQQEAGARQKVLSGMASGKL